MGQATRESSPPTAERVAARLLVLTALVQRAYLETFQKNGATDTEETRRMLVDVLDGVGLTDEIEPGERELFETPVGRADEGALMNASWRVEGLAVLAWALDRYDLPGYDQCVPTDDFLTPDAPLTADRFFKFLGGEAEDLRETGVLRPREEIGAFTSHITVVGWRLRQFRLAPGPMDYVGYLRAHPFFKERWLQNVRLIGSDLAIGDRAIAEAPADYVAACEGSADERRQAAYWLAGDDAVYSNVDPSTILTAC